MIRLGDDRIDTERTVRWFVGQVNAPAGDVPVFSLSAITGSVELIAGWASSGGGVQASMQMREGTLGLVSDFVWSAPNTAPNAGPNFGAFNVGTELLGAFPPDIRSTSADTLFLPLGGLGMIIERGRRFALVGTQAAATITCGLAWRGSGGGD
jgi:hypothetical protein